MKKTLIYVVILFLSFSNYTIAQQKVNVITKTIKKEFDYEQEKIIIRGEKSNINIYQWQGDKLKIQIDLIAKNPSKLKAEKDIEVLQYSIGQKGDSINLGNFFKSNKIVGISSNLSVDYHIYIPLKCYVDIKNLYGKVNIHNVRIYGKIDNSFGSTSLQNTSGNCLVNLYYSKFTSNSTNGELKVNAENSNLTLKNISGIYELYATYGEIHIESLQNLKELKISAQRSSVFLTVERFKDYNYELETFKNEIIIPEVYRDKIIKASSTSSYKNKFSANNNMLNIKTTYCPITVK
jgi:hypothetical protein